MSFVRKRVIFDTSILVSAVLSPSALPARLLQTAIKNCVIFLSPETFAELKEVLFRPKFDRYFIGDDIRESFLKDLFLHAVLAEITIHVTDCSDPKDNIFLSLARSVNAHYLVSGDKRHLLSMNPYHGILILTPAELMEKII